VHNVEENVSQDDTVSKPVGTSKYPGPSIAAPTTPHFPVGVLSNHMGVGSDIMEMLWSMPNSKMLKELSERSMQWA
jgi:hypothetical protein